MTRLPRSPAPRRKSPPAAHRAESVGTDMQVPPMDAQVRTLDNGLEIIVREDHEHPLVSVQIWVRAGSLHEEKWTGAGLAHCLEHMLFKGTLKRTAEEISQDIQNLGGQVNAYTTFNRTVYWIDGLAEHTGGYLDILADMIRHSRIDPAELEKEQEVIRREMAMDHDDPGAAVQHLVQAISFREHPLRHPIIGHRQVFDQISRNDVAAFMARHYVPNNCFIVIAGAVTAAQVFADVQRLFGDWERRPYQPVLLPLEPPQKGMRAEHKPFATELTRVALGWQIGGEGHPDKPALDVLAFLLGSGRSSRLYQALRERRAIAHWVWAGAWGAQECGLFNIEAECDPQDQETCHAAMLQVVEAIQKRGPDAGELAKAVRATLSAQVRSLMSTKGQASALGHGWITVGSLDHQRQYLQAIRDLTPGDVRDAARRYLIPSSCSIAVVGPQAPIANQTPAASGRHVEVQRLELANGLTLLIGENPRLPHVSLRASFLAGVPAESDATAGITQVAAALMLKGTRNRTAQQIASELENRGAALHCTADAHRLILGADVMSGDMQRGLDLIADLALNATLPPARLPEVKKRQLAALQEEQEDPLTVALRRARREIFAGTPFARTALGSVASITSLNATACRKHLAQTLQGANGVISIYGNVKTAAVRKQVEKAFIRLKRGARRDSASTTHQTPPIGKPGTWEQRMDKEQAVIVIGFRTVGLHDPDSHILTLIDEACSDMGSRLFNRIREELGLAYYVGAQHFAAMGAGAFYFYVGTSETQAPLALTEMMAQIDDLRKNGLTASEIQRAKTTWRSSWLRAQQGNASMADTLAWNEINGHGHDHFQRLPALIDAITTADVKRTAARYFGRARAYTVKILPGT